MIFYNWSFQNIWIDVGRPCLRVFGELLVRFRKGLPDLPVIKHQICLHSPPSVSPVQCASALFLQARVCGLRTSVYHSPKAPAVQELKEYCPSLSHLHTMRLFVPEGPVETGTDRPPAHNAPFGISTTERANVYSGRPQRTADLNTVNLCHPLSPCHFLSQL